MKFPTMKCVILHECKEVHEMLENKLQYDDPSDPENNLDYAHPRANEWERMYRKIT